ncbi:hypothetical protein E4U41_007611 [Claviceps citrina]|nr:hypothetical protein E4U41_007611 [Claviceps citrina]
MASPDVFLSSPLRRSRQYIVPSSSPDLPSIQDLMAQKTRRPAIKSGSKTTSITDTATSTFSGARDLWRSAQAAKINQIDPSQDANQLLVIDDNDAATTSIEPASNGKTPPRRRRWSNATPEASRQLDQRQTQIDDALETMQQPWKKFKPKTPEKDAVRAFEGSESECLDSIYFAADLAPADDTIGTCPPMEDSLLSAQLGARVFDFEDSLQLEPAMIRRKDWTPPKQTATSAGRSESPAAVDFTELDDEKTESFETLLTAYKCGDGAIDESASHQSDGSASKKRRLTGVEPVRTAMGPTITIATTVAKKKAARKKPRTITALATAAYKQATQVDCADAAAQDTNHALSSHQQQAVQPKAKAKPRKRPAKSKKKIQPPKPLLFSPETALKQVAQQDFVFGTSSQLAGEQSPTFLRDLQRAMKSSNQLDEVDYTTPLNSDSIEPLECRPKLWDAAARDAEGDLFDVEVINLTEGDACAPQTPGDPFGYCKGDSRLPGTEHANEASKEDDGFVDISDILPATSEAVLPTSETPSTDPFSSHPPSPESRGEPHPPVPLASNQNQETDGPGPQPQPHAQPPATSTSAPGASFAPRPAFEGYTDAQLSMEVNRYGFKPIKRRSAMIALLEQCWQQKMGHSGQAVRTKSTVATASKPTTPSPAKRPRGRPRKDSVSALPAQDPPPSGQAPETPKRPRGRPRKDSINALPAQDPPPSAQVQETPKRPRGRPRKNAETSPSTAKVPKRTTPPKSVTKRKATSTRARGAKVVEIPDSDSDLADTLHSRSSSPSSTCSSLQQDIDLAVSLGADTDPSLAMASTDAECSLFDYITRAITTAPRTTDPTAPSWHEKILLYDPIVLEDLATWLNSGQLTRVGCDEETSPVELKKWCESKSICCLWKVNLRGKERKRY